MLRSLDVATQSELVDLELIVDSDVSPSLSISENDDDDADNNSRLLSTARGIDTGQEVEVKNNNNPFVTWTMCSARNENPSNNN